MRKMRLLRQLLAFTIAVGLVGCAVQQADVLTPIPKSQVQFKQYGAVKLTVRWPSRTYNTNVIPESTTKLVIKISKDGVEKVTKDIIRDASQSVMVTTINDLVAGSGYTAEIRAFRDTTDLAYGTTASEFTIASGRVTNVPPVTLVSDSAPAIYSLNNQGPGNQIGAVGDYINITGKNFASGSITFHVYFNGEATDSLEATEVTRNDEQHLTARVPAGAKTGNVKIRVDGLDSGSAATFWVADSVSLPATASVIDGSMVEIPPTINYIYAPGKSKDNYGGVEPHPIWAVVEDGLLTKVTDAGRFSVAANDVATAHVTASVGSLTSAPCAVDILPNVTSMNISTSDITLNARPDDDSMTYPWKQDVTVVVNSDTFTNQGVTWTSSDPTQVEIGANNSTSATIQATMAASADAVVYITATSKDNPDIQQSVTVHVTRNGGLNAEVN